jgi:death-on-curing protein
MSIGPKFLTYKQILRLHELQIEEFGGHPGVKEEGLVKSAIAQPFAGTGDGYFHKDMFEMAAAYLFHLVRNHAFHEGTKELLL